MSSFWAADRTTAGVGIVVSGPELARQAVDACNRRDVDGLFAELATPDFGCYPAQTEGAIAQGE